MNASKIETRAEEIKKLVDHACKEILRVKSRKRRMVMRQLEKRLQRPLTEYMADGWSESIQEARTIVRKAIQQARGNTRKGRR